jgi:hypothetical protein
VTIPETASVRTALFAMTNTVLPVSLPKNLPVGSLPC